jgi:hypothetical protein
VAAGARAKPVGEVGAMAFTVDNVVILRSLPSRHLIVAGLPKLAELIPPIQAQFPVMVQA